MSAGIHCPSCNMEASKVIDSRPNGNGIRRRRECTKCGNRFSTYECVEATT